MRKQLFGMVLFFILLSSCISNESKNDPVKKNVSELDKAIIVASDTINRVLPARSIVALFNNSRDESDLTNYVIEEMHSILTNKRNLRVVERDRIENMEIEHNWQMDTGYVPDEEVTSIVEKLGAQYVVSCYITGNGNLQRLRIKTWNLKTGETLASSVFPTNEIGVQLVKAVENKVMMVRNEDNIIQTIRESGITIDYNIVNYVDEQGRIGRYIMCEIYVDNTQYYSMMEFISKKENNRITTMWRFYNKSDSGNENVSNLLNPNNDVLSEEIVTFLLNNGVERRTSNIVSRLIKERIYDKYQLK